MSRRLIGTVLGFLTVGLLLTAAPGASADTTACSQGDALAVFNAFGAIFIHDPQDDPWPAYPDCQYRMWAHGEHFTFQEDDWFLTGATYAYPYQAAGVTRDEAIAELAKYSDRLWLTKLQPGTRKAIGPAVEQPLTLTAYSDAVHPEDGLLVYRQTGAILHLPPGDYLSFNENKYDGKIRWRNTVILHILPTG